MLLRSSLKLLLFLVTYILFCFSHRIFPSYILNGVFAFINKEISINKGVLISTHNIDMVIKYADRVLVLKDKKIVYDGLPKEDLYKII